MIRIIHTPCSRATSAIDAGMTAIGWAGFAYLASSSILSISMASTLQGDAPSLSLVAPTLETLLIYLTIAAFNALLVVLWGTYHKRLFPPPRKVQARSAPDDAITAADFALSSAQLHDVHGSRITVIHHTDDGEIAALQTDKLRIPPVSNSDIFDATRLA